MDVQDQVAGSQTTLELESVRFNIDFPVVWTDRWAYGHVSTRFSHMALRSGALLTKIKPQHMHVLNAL